MVKRKYRQNAEGQSDKKIEDLLTDTDSKTVKEETKGKDKNHERKSSHMNHQTPGPFY